MLSALLQSGARYCRLDKRLTSRASRHSARTSLSSWTLLPGCSACADLLSIVGMTTLPTGDELTILNTYGSYVREGGCLRWTIIWWPSRSSVLADLSEYAAEKYRWWLTTVTSLRMTIIRLWHLYLYWQKDTRLSRTMNLPRLRRLLIYAWIGFGNDITFCMNSPFYLLVVQHMGSNFILRLSKYSTLTLPIFADIVIYLCVEVVVLCNVRLEIFNLPISQILWLTCVLRLLDCAM